MAKRFTDTELWNQDWFIILPKDYKMFWGYITDACDHAGIWRPNAATFNKMNDCAVELPRSIKLFNQDKERISVLGNGRWFLTGFIPFQYGTTLNLASRLHRSVFQLLKDNGVKLTSIRPLVEVMHSPKDKDKDKDISVTETTNVTTERDRTPHQVFTDWYLHDVENINRERFSDDSKYKAAITAGYQRFSRSIKQILAFADGDVEKAKEGTRAIGLWLQRRDLSWGADTVSKWFNEWARNPKEFGKNGKY